MSSLQEKDTDYLTLFPYCTIPKLHGEPTYKTLKALKDKIKANASVVQSDLGGGAHGHLGLVLVPLEYANSSATPYLRPAHPGPLIIPPRLTARQEN